MDADEIKELRDALWAVADAYSPGAEANVGAGAGEGESDDDVNSEMDY